MSQITELIRGRISSACLVDWNSKRNKVTYHMSIHGSTVLLCFEDYLLLGRIYRQIHSSLILHILCVHFPLPLSLLPKDHIHGPHKKTFSGLHRTKCIHLIIFNCLVIMKMIAKIGNTKGITCESVN